METIEELKKKIKEQERKIEDLEDALYDGDGVNLVNYWYQQCQIAENGLRNYARELDTYKEIYKEAVSLIPHTCETCFYHGFCEKNDDGVDNCPCSDPDKHDGWKANLKIKG